MVPRLPLHLLPHRRGCLHGRRHPGLPLARRHVRLAAARAADGHGDAAADDAGGSGARGHQGEGFGKWLGNGWEIADEDIFRKGWMEGLMDFTWIIQNDVDTM